MNTGSLRYPANLTGLCRSDPYPWPLRPREHCASKGAICQNDMSNLSSNNPPPTFALSHIQVILCFSPVGSVLRVRARKFPAVVNCTAINWFHEWPEDALVSVSARFLQETEGIQVRQRAPRCWLQSLTWVSFKAGMILGAGQSCSIGEHLFKSRLKQRSWTICEAGSKSLSSGRMTNARESPSSGIQCRNCPAILADITSIG